MMSKTNKNRKSSSQQEEQRFLPRKTSSQQEEQRKALHDLAAARLVKIVPIHVMDTLTGNHVIINEPG